MVERNTQRLLAALSISLVVAVNSATAGPNANSRTNTESFSSSEHTRHGVSMLLHGDPGTIGYENAAPFHRFAGAPTTTSVRKYTGSPQEEDDSDKPEPFQSYQQLCDPKLDLPCSIGPVHFFIPVSPFDLLNEETKLAKFMSSLTRTGKGQVPTGVDARQSKSRRPERDHETQLNKIPPEGLWLCDEMYKTTEEENKQPIAEAHR